MTMLRLNDPLPPTTAVDSAAMEMVNRIAQVRMQAAGLALNLGEHIDASGAVVFRLVTGPSIEIGSVEETERWLEQQAKEKAHGRS